MTREELMKQYGHNYEHLHREDRISAMAHVYRMFDAPLTEAEKRILALNDQKIKEARLDRRKREKEKYKKRAKEERL